MVGLGVFLATFALYFATFDVLHDGQLLGNDAMPYAHQLARGDAEGLFNAHHLLFHFLSFGVAKGMTLVGAAFDELTILRAQQLLSAMGGALAVLAVFAFATRSAGRTVGSLVAAVYAVCFGQWLYSAVGETYSPATAMTAVLLVQAAETRLGWRRENVFTLALWLLLAVSFRQDAVLVVCALPLLLRPSSTLLVTVGAGSLALLLYVTAWTASGLELSFREWTLGLAGEGKWGHAPGLEALTTSIGVLLTTIHSGVMQWRPVVRGDLGALAEPMAWASLLSIGLLAASATRPTALGRPAVRVLVALAFLALVRLAFYTWWQPANLEYHTGTLLPLALVLALLCAGRGARGSTWTLSIALALIAGSNLMAVVLPNRVTTTAERSRAAVQEAGRGGVVVAMTANQLHAFHREPPAEAELIDAVDVFVRRDPSAIAPFWAGIDADLAAGRRVVFARELGLWTRLGFPERPLDIDDLTERMAGRSQRMLTDENGEPWGMVLEP